MRSRFCLFGGGTASSTSRRETDDRVLRRAAAAASASFEVSWEIRDVLMVTEGELLVSWYSS